MAGLTIPLEGEIALLNTLLQAALAADEPLILKLYSNVYFPVSATTGSNFTECNFTNYAAKTLTRAGWGGAVAVSGIAVATHSVIQQWTVGTTSQTIQGYYMVGSVSGKVLWAEKFPQARPTATGDVVTLQPQFSLKSIN